MKKVKAISLFFALIFIGFLGFGYTQNQAENRTPELPTPPAPVDFTKTATLVVTKLTDVTPPLPLPAPTEMTITPTPQAPAVEDIQLEVIQAAPDDLQEPIMPMPQLAGIEEETLVVTDTKKQAALAEPPVKTGPSIDVIADVLHRLQIIETRLNNFDQRIAMLVQTKGVEQTPTQSETAQTPAERLREMHVLAREPVVLEGSYIRRENESEPEDVIELESFEPTTPTDDAPEEESFHGSL